MKNITVSVDEETHRLARIRAAELDTSVSAMVRQYLGSFVNDAKSGPTAKFQGGETETERRGAKLDEVYADFAARGVGLRMTSNLSRAELYDRARARDEAQMAAALEDARRNRG